MVAYIILAIFIIFAALRVTIARSKTIKSEINVKKILAHSPKDEDKMQQ